MIFKKQIQAEEILKSEKEKLKNAEYWISFLKTSAMQYKHNWNTQIAIHEAMPDSIACTEAKIWKENGCTLTDTANAIITEKDGKICRLFDISQVSGEFTKSYWIWKVNDDELNVDYSEALNDTLCSKYNLDSETLAETIYSIALDKTSEFIDKNNDVYNVIAESVAYTVIQRCCPDEVEMSYDSIENALKTTSIDKIGTAVTIISKILLTEIETIVKKERTSEIDRRGLDEYNREHIDKRNEMRVQSEQEKILPDNQDSGRENLHTERKDIPLHSDSESGVRPQRNNYSAAFEMPEGSGGTGEERTSVLNSSPMANNDNIIGNTTYKYIPQKSYRKYDIDIAMKISEKLESENIKYSGKIADDTITFTVSKPDVSKLEEIAEKIKEDLDFTFEADTKKFANGELSTADKSVGFKPYIIADLKTWTNNSPERSKLERYETLDEAFKRFDELRNEPYNSEIALHKQDNFPMARLTLGVESSDGEYAFDVIHVRAGQNYLCDDFTRIPDVFTNKNFTDILTNISENITIDRIAIYEKDENENYKDTPEDVAFNDVKSKELFTELGEEYSKLIPDNTEKTEQISDDIFKEAIYPSLASDEWTAITTEFFSYETAWHNVDEKISSLAKSYRSGKDITAELGQYFGVGRSLGTSPDDKKFILDRNENSVKITHIQNNHSAEYTWSDIGSIQLQMLKDRFKEDTLDAIREYPDTAAINNHYIERMESENYPEKESTEKLMPIVIEKYGLEIDFNEIEDITFEIGENISIICFYSKENTLFRDESGVNSSLSPVEALSSATDEIEKLFDMSVNNPDIKIFINHKDNTQQLLNPEKMREDVLKNRISESDKIIENLENTLKELQPENKLELEIDFSESGEIERFKSEYLNGDPMSYALGNALLEYLDEKQHTERETEELNVGWYHKTDFSIKAVINGEDYSYNGRYDIGDGKDGGNGSLSEHIRQYNEYAVTNNPYHLTDEELEERLEILNVFVPFLEENSVLNEKEQQIFDTYISENPVRTEINLENSSDNSKDIVYRIYQIKSGEEYHYARFSSFESNIEHNIQLNKDDYDLVYEGNLSDINGSSVEDKLSKIYEIFNLNHPEDFRGHSLSVSDVITLDNTNAYYVDSFGFKDFPAFFLEKTKELENDSKRTAEDIAIGDKYMYNGAEVTVASLTGVYPDDIGISKTEELNDRAFSVTTNINKHNLHNEGKYLGNLNDNIENTMTADKFYENRDTQSVTWMYYNPDGNDGKGQFIETVIYKEDIENALNKANSSRNSTQAFMDTFYNCTQTITDRGTESFSTAEKYYNEAEYDFAVEGNYNDALSDIRNYLTDYYNSFDNVPALTQADIDILRTLEPRKSILNFTSEEIKLTEKWQQRFEADIDKKSPYYRAVNGDWREHETTSVPVLTIEDRNADFKSVKDDIKNQTIFRGNIINNDTGWNIQISRKGLEDTFMYANKHNDSATFNALYHIDGLIKTGVLLDTNISEYNNNNKSINTAFMHKFYNIFKFNNENFIAKITIEELFDGRNSSAKRLYNLQDIKIESLRHLSFTDLNQPHLSVLNDSNISISDLFKIVKTCDNDFYLNKGENHIEQISLFDMPENTSEITEESKEIVWTPITETADDNGKPTSYSTLYKGERYWITQVDKYKFDIEYDTTNGIQAINDDFSGFSSRTQAEEFFEDEIDDFLELTQTHFEQEISETDIAENDYSPMANSKNYRIETDNFELGGEKSKFKANIEAIRTMKTIESENRTATHEEMEIMSKYTGWGGLQNAFDNRKDNWSNEYAELKNLLTEDEYLSAKASVLDSFYTPPFVIDSIYKALENMGFEGGKILDPATGVGNFLGKMPESISVKSKITAVEKDSISGRIAKALYPEAEINISGFEDTVYPDNTFDVAIGNIPFGDFKLSDRNYDKHNFMIHDYFFAKSIDKVHPGGIIAFITSKGTLDKANPKVRKYISERADLIGAIRLPNSTFKSYAGTEVTSDIIFLQKREQLNDIAPDWVYTDIDKNGFSVNSYFASHPEMILGETVEGNKLYGSKDTMVVPFENSDLKELLDKATSNIKGEYKNIAVKKEKTEKAKSILPANPDIRNYSFGEIDGKIYYREDNIMTLQNLSGKRLARMKGMCDISKQVHKLLDIQLEGYPEEYIQKERDELNRIYDKFISEHGLLNEKANADLFYKDVSAPLLLSLEIVKDGKLEDKSAIFTRTTIKPPTVITHAESSQDALIVSISEKACVDMDFMQELTGKSEDEIYNELKGDIFKDPLSNNGKARYITADEYLSGNIREKLKIAKLAAENSGEFVLNVNALEKSMPVPLEAGEIAAQLGSSWIDTKYIEQFIREKLDIKNHYIDVKVHHNEYTASWNIQNKSILTQSSFIKSTEEYGTSRKSAAEIIENSLNMRDTSVYDVVYNPDTEKEERILNHDETLLARQKQTTLQNEFKDWIFEDADRRNALVEKYNVLYNSVRQRQYNGENLTFGGMTTDIQMKPHQKDAIAHALYGGNTLFAHKVGAGKTFEMIATAMEGKRLGLHSKSLIAVPNHMTRQFANDFFKLYPNANILVAEEKDFAKDNRRNLIAKIATGDFDAVIIGHSQLIKIPISREREEAYINKEIANVVAQIENMKAEKGDSFTIKDMERVRKNLQAKLDKLLSKPVRDNVVTFEQLGVDKLIIDEADMFKNLFINTKMSNLSGVATNENVQKTQDLFMKCQYLNEITDGKGIVFATGTPISNSISEAYVMQKYLNPKALEESGLAHFDAWAANFAQKVTRTEFSPDGRGFRTKTRLAKFNNLPELMSMFKDFTDIKMAEDLNLPEPECERHTISVEATPVQKDLMQSLGERAEMIHNKMVRPDVDNMLKITTDGTKIGLDQRLIDPILPDDPDSKVNTCINNVFKIYNDTQAERLTQVIFCDYSTPKADGSFSIYDDIRKKLIEKGVPENEVAFIHDCKNNRQKEELFAKVRNGDVRIILGSTQKMGAGTNIQTKLYALHHLDPTWKPRDMEQRLGRMKRQGNENEKVHEYIYVTKDTFDANRYQTLEIKQGYISQIMTNHNPIRSCDDISPEEMSFAEVKAACVGNPLIKEKMELDIDIAQLQSLKSSYLKSHYRLEDSINAIPKKIENRIKLYENAVKDEAIVNANPTQKDEEGNSIFSGITINGEFYSDRKQAGEALISYSSKALLQNNYKSSTIGEYRGFKLVIWFDAVFKETKLDICRNNTYSINLSQSDTGNMTRIENAINGISSKTEEYKLDIQKFEKELAEAKIEFEKPFPQEQELKDKIARQSFLERELSKENEDVMIDKNDNQKKEQERSAQTHKKNDAVEL